MERISKGKVVAIETKGDVDGAAVTVVPPLALFSDNGHLEIAIREGSAAQLLGLKVQDMITIEFYG